jgi:exopolyphosphatase/guanosine-5'-triphosphate,3'-diphosphate pyrophosphatase
MAKITTIIDIGSNSCRMVVLKKSSRFAFHLVHEIKSRVRISEGAYDNGGYLQDYAIDRAISALKEFKDISNRFKAKKILCVATSAVRDAPNGNEFKNRVKKELGINIKIIDGPRESYLGGVAAVNLLPIDDAITIDIGGGSTELALIKDKKIQKAISLNIGTVRLKELFSDKSSVTEAKEFVSKALEDIPDEYLSDTMVGIGGTARALAKMLVPDDYPIKNIHAFSYDIDKLHNLTEQIIYADSDELKKLGVKKDRLDTIKEGALILSMITQRLGSKVSITSGAGVREGLFLVDLLRNSNDRFPENFNVSVRSLCDRFSVNEDVANYNQNISTKLFEALKPLHNIDDKFKRHVQYASKMADIGLSLGFYHKHYHSNYFVMNNLTYGFTHEDRALIATLIKFNKRKLLKEQHIELLRKLLPELDTINWLSYIVTFANTLNSSLANPKVEFELFDNTLKISSNDTLTIAKERIEKLEMPDGFNVEFV